MKTAVPERTRLKLCVRGAVQGVGFRPFVYRLATELALAGWVNNSPQGVFIEVEGERGELEKFLLRLETEKPPRSFIQSLEASWLDPIGYDGFEIRESETGGDQDRARPAGHRHVPGLPARDLRSAQPPLPLSVHQLHQLRPALQHHRIAALRPREHLDEAVHDVPAVPGRIRRPARPPLPRPAQRLSRLRPAAGIVGPHRRVEVDADGTVRDPRSRRLRHQALLAAAEAIRAGQIVAVKGLGGFHLMVAAHDDAAVRRLRERKHREEKPFALMFPSLEAVRDRLRGFAAGRAAAPFPEAPIVLLAHRLSFAE